jgi:hypothetical protein
VTTVTSVRRIVESSLWYDKGRITIAGNRDMRPSERVNNVLWSKVEGIQAVSEWHKGTIRWELRRLCDSGSVVPS